MDVDVVLARFACLLFVLLISNATRNGICPPTAGIECFLLISLRCLATHQATSRKASVRFCGGILFSIINLQPSNLPHSPGWTSVECQVTCPAARLPCHSWPSIVYFFCRTYTFFLSLAIYRISVVSFHVWDHALLFLLLLLASTNTIELDTTVRPETRFAPSRMPSILASKNLLLYQCNTRRVTSQA